MTVSEVDLKKEHEPLLTEETEKWTHLRAKRVNGTGTLEGKPFLPRTMLIPSVRELHHRTRAGAPYLGNQVSPSRVAPGLTLAILQVTEGCLICAEYNAKSKTEEKSKGPTLGPGCRPRNYKLTLQICLQKTD